MHLLHRLLPTCIFLAHYSSSPCAGQRPPAGGAALQDNSPRAGKRAESEQHALSCASCGGLGGGSARGAFFCPLLLTPLCPCQPPFCCRYSWMTSRVPSTSGGRRQVSRRPGFACWPGPTFCGTAGLRLAVTLCFCDGPGAHLRKAPALLPTNPASRRRAGRHRAAPAGRHAAAAVHRGAGDPAAPAPGGLGRSGCLTARSALACGWIVCLPAHQPQSSRTPVSHNHLRPFPHTQICCHPDLAPGEDPSFLAQQDAPAQLTPEVAAQLVELLRVRAAPRWLLV